MINDIKGEKTIDLSYPIHSKKEIAVVSMHISNSQILLHVMISVILRVCYIEFLLKNGQENCVE